MALANFATYITRNAPVASAMRISRTPAPMAFTGLPVLRREPALDPIELKAGFPPRSLRKRP